MKTIAIFSIFLSSALSLPALGTRDENPIFPIHNGTIPTTPPHPLGTGTAVVKPTSTPVPKPTGGAGTACAPGAYRCAAQNSGMGEEGWEVCQLGGVWTWAGACGEAQVCVFNEMNGSPYCVAAGTGVYGSETAPTEVGDGMDSTNTYIPSVYVPEPEDSDLEDGDLDEGSESDAALPEIEVEVEEAETYGDGTEEDEDEDEDEEDILEEEVPEEEIEEENTPDQIIDVDYK